MFTVPTIVKQIFGKQHYSQLIELSRSLKEKSCQTVVMDRRMNQLQQIDCLKLRLTVAFDKVGSRHSNQELPT